MKRAENRGRPPLALIVLGLLLTGCTENTAPGNDRKAELDPPAIPAEVMSAGAALEGVETGLLMPEIMTDADMTSLPELGSRCLFRMTRVDHPVVVYGSMAVVKLNGKLVPLPATGEGRYAADGVTVSIRPLAYDDPEAATLAPAELVLRLPDAPDELGFHGFSEC